MSEIRAGIISDSGGTRPITLTAQWAVRGYSYYNQTTNTVIDSGNVAAITDVNAGRYTVNYTNPFTLLEPFGQVTGAEEQMEFSPSLSGTLSMRVQTKNGSASLTDSESYNTRGGELA